MTHYPRAPITEALIEIRFAEPIAKDAVDKVKTRLNEAYVSVDPWSVKNLQVDVTAVSASVIDSTDGYRLSDLDHLDICIITTRNFTVSRLAPYTKWEELYDRARSNWTDWKRIVGYKRIQRLGVRYINRIDIPCPPGQPVELSEYVHCYPVVPPLRGFPPLANYAMQTAMPAGPDGLTLVINSASVPSPVPNHTSIILDIDISRESDMPQNDEGLWELVARVRGYKNEVFEASITPKAQALFA